MRASQCRREIEHHYAFSQRLLMLERVPELLNLGPHQQNELLTVINEESDRMNALVEEATQMAWNRSNELHLTLHDIREAIDRALESAKKTVNMHPINFDTKVELPPLEFD